MGNHPILLCEDCADTADLLRIAFYRGGFGNFIHTVGRGEEAFKYLKGVSQYADRARFPFPYLMLLNTCLPGISGWDVLRWTRREPQCKQLVVVMMSRAGSLDEAKQAEELGANGFEIKPTEFNALLQMVKKVGDSWLRGK
jgi:DNA-binding response OmpR family regulator